MSRAEREKELMEGMKKVSQLQHQKKLYDYESYE